MIKELRELEVWFVTGSQHLYGEETLKQVDQNSKEIGLLRHWTDAVPYL